MSGEAIYTLPEAAPAPVVADTEGTYVYNDQHAEQAVANLIEFFRKPRSSEIMRIVGGQVQDVEDAIWQLYTAFDMNTATGMTLDLLGGVVGEARANRTDDDYRAAVRARILVNRSNGRLEDMLAVLVALLPDNTGIVVHEFYPASIRFDVFDAFAGATAETVARMLRQSKPAGVKLTFVPVDTDTTMIWHAAGPDATNGWGANWGGVL
jgi:hypothetical protein